VAVTKAVSWNNPLPPFTYPVLECKETKYWREKLIHDKWLNMNKEITCRKMLKINK
jgi:hypothetical protein